MTVVTELDGNKVGWALGAMLYEINVMPWTISDTPDGAGLAKYFLCIVVGGVFGALMTLFIGRRALIEDKSADVLRSRDGIREAHTYYGSGRSGRSCRLHSRVRP